MRKIIQKKAQLNSMLLFGLIIMVVLIGGVFLVMSSGILTFVGNEVNDITSTLGVQGNTNLSHASDVSIGVVNNGIQMLSWGSGFVLFLALVGLLMFAATIRLNPNGFMIGLYIMMVLIFVITAIYMSNIYETFLNGSDEIATELKSMTIANFLIIFMPHIITGIAFVGGIIIFTGMGEENLA